MKSANFKDLTQFLYERLQPISYAYVTQPIYYELDCLFIKFAESFLCVRLRQPYNLSFILSVKDFVFISLKLGHRRNVAPYNQR